MVFVDLFTRWVECISLRRVRGEAVLKDLVERVFLRCGTPEVFLSDNGTEFKNRLIDEYLAKKGVTYSTIPAYFPQMNFTEQVNRTLKTMIVSFMESHQRWDEHLQELAFACNTAKQSSTVQSPAMLNYGRQPAPIANAFRARCNNSLLLQKSNGTTLLGAEPGGCRIWNNCTRMQQKIHIARKSDRHSIVIPVTAI